MAKSSHQRGENKRWVKSVKTVSTFPPEGTFDKPAKEVARIMARPSVSPKGLWLGHPDGSVFHQSRR